MELSKLVLPFPAKDIEWRVGATTADKTKGIALAYVTNRAIQNRLDDVCGALNWQNEYIEWHGNSQICGISIWDETKKQWIKKWDGADNTDFESTKGGLSDSMKRAGYQWGIGRYLYNLPNSWVPIKNRGKSFVLCDTPKLPDEFLPESERGKQPPIKKEDIEELITFDQVTEIQDAIKERQGIDVPKILNWCTKAWGYPVKEIADVRQKNIKSLMTIIQKNPLK